jgi:phage gp37-like protein
LALPKAPTSKAIRPHLLADQKVLFLLYFQGRIRPLRDTSFLTDFLHDTRQVDKSGFAPPFKEGVP